MNNMNIAIIGSRKGFNEERIFSELKKHKITNFDKIISGGAIGVDSFAAKYSRMNNVEIEIIRPIKIDIGYGIKMNYIFRNIEIITKADKLIIFWNGKSGGTMQVINYARERKKDLIIIHEEE